MADPSKIYNMAGKTEPRVLIGQGEVWYNSVIHTTLAAHITSQQQVNTYLP